MFALCVSLYTVAGVWVLPAADIYKSSRYFSEQIAERVGPDDALRLYRPWRWRASYSYYLNRSIPPLESPEALQRFFAEPQAGYVIVEGDLDSGAAAALGDSRPLVTRRVGSRMLRLYATRADESPGDQSGGL